MEAIIKMHNALDADIRAALEAKLATCKGVEYKIIIPAIISGDTSAVVSVKDKEAIELCVKNINKNFFRIVRDFGNSINAYREYAKTHNVGECWTDGSFKCYEYLA